VCLLSGWLWGCWRPCTCREGEVEGGVGGGVGLLCVCWWDKRREVCWCSGCWHDAYAYHLFQFRIYCHLPSTSVSTQCIWSQDCWVAAGWQQLVQHMLSICRVILHPALDAAPALWHPPHPMRCHLPSSRPAGTTRPHASASPTPRLLRPRQRTTPTCASHTPTWSWPCCRLAATATSSPGSRPGTTSTSKRCVCAGLSFPACQCCVVLHAVLDHACTCTCFTPAWCAVRAYPVWVVLSWQCCCAVLAVPNTLPFDVAMPDIASLRKSHTLCLLSR
jgi:hypothetical protein